MQTQQRPIRILFIASTLDGGGAQRVLLTVLRHLNPEQFAPTLLLFKRSGVYWQDVPANVRVACLVEKSRLRHAPIRAIGNLWSKAKRHDLIIGAVELSPTYLAWIIGRLLNKPVIGWVHINIESYLKHVAPKHRHLARWLYPRLRYGIFVSDGAKESMLRMVGASERVWWQTIYNPVHFTVTTPYAATAHSEAIDKNVVPTVVAAGRLCYQKGFDTLIRAHAKLIARGLNHTLTILGDGPSRVELEELIAQLGVGHSVVMPGFVTDPVSYFESATVFAMSSRFEGLPMVIIEAMTIGLPVVATACPDGPSELLDEGRYGRLVPVNDAEALASGIAEVLQDGELREHLKRVGSERASDFAPEKIVPEWEALINSILSDYASLSHKTLISKCLRALTRT